MTFPICFSNSVNRSKARNGCHNQRGFGKALAKQAIEIARQQGGLTVFAVVDALTRLSASLKNAGDRAEADERAGRLLALAA